MVWRRAPALHELAACPDLRAVTMLDSQAHAVDVGRVAAVDTLSTLSVLMLVRLRATGSFRGLISKAVGTSAGWRWTLDSPGTGMLMRFYRATTATSYFTHTTSGLTFPLYSWRWIAVTADLSLGTGKKIRFWSSGLDQLLRPVTLGTQTEGAGAQSSDAAATIALGGVTGVALAPSADVAFAALWGGVVSERDLHAVQQDPRAALELRVPSFGLWLPGHGGQEAVPDYGPLQLHGTIIGAAATSGGAPGYWRQPVADAGRVPTATTFTQTLAGGATPAGALTRRAALGLSAGVTPSGALANLKVVILTLGGALAPAASLVRRTTKGLTAGLAPSGGMIRRATRLFAAGVTPAGALASLKVVILALGGGLSPAATLVRRTSSVLAGALSPVATLAKRVTRLLAATGTPSGAVTRRVTRGMAGSLAPIGAVVTQLIPGGAALLKLVAGVVIRPALAARTELAPLLEAATRLRARFRGTTTIDPET